MHTQVNTPNNELSCILHNLQYNSDIPLNLHNNLIDNYCKLINLNIADNLTGIILNYMFLSWHQEKNHLNTAHIWSHSHKYHNFDCIEPPNRMSHFKLKSNNFQPCTYHMKKNRYIISNLKSGYDKERICHFKASISIDVDIPHFHKAMSYNLRNN